MGAGRGFIRTQLKINISFANSITGTVILDVSGRRVVQKTTQFIMQV
jgi:hypothetical protein